MKKNSRIAITPLAKIKPWEGNPRNIPELAVEVVAKSIEKFGFVQPILTDLEGRICSGHTRYLAAVKLKLKTVPVIKREMTEEEFVAYNLADNKTAEFTNWNLEGVRESWEALDDFPDLQDVTGFELEEAMGVMRDEPADEDAPDDPVDTGAAPAETGKVFKLYFAGGEYEEFRDLLDEIPGGSPEEKILKAVKDFVNAGE